MAKEHTDKKGGKKGGKAHSGFTSDPGSGVAQSKTKKSGGKKAIMSQSAWDKLSSKQKDDLGGSRFRSTGGSSSRERGSGSA